MSDEVGLIGNPPNPRRSTAGYGGARYERQIPAETLPLGFKCHVTEVLYLSDDTTEPLQGVKTEYASEVNAFILEPQYTEIGCAIAADGHGFNLLEEMLRQLAPFMDRAREVVVDGFYDTESGDPAIMAKVRTTVEDARDVLSKIDEFQAGDWWWENRRSAGFDLILSVGA